MRDALYVNGGDLTSNDGFAMDGLTRIFNFSQSFETNSNNFSALFAPLHSQSPAADYYDGTMFATDDEIYLYGYA